jgi:hypothetical protein
MFCLWGPADCILFSLPMWLRMPARHIVSFGWTGEYVNTYLTRRKNVCVNSLFLCPCLLFHLSLPPPRPPPLSLSPPPLTLPALIWIFSVRVVPARQEDPSQGGGQEGINSLISPCLPSVELGGQERRRARWAGEGEGHAVPLQGGGGFVQEAQGIFIGKVTEGFGLQSAII